MEVIVLGAGSGMCESAWRVSIAAKWKQSVVSSVSRGVDGNNGLAVHGSCTRFTTTDRRVSRPLGDTVRVTTYTSPICLTIMKTSPVGGGGCEKTPCMRSVWHLISVRKNSIKTNVQNRLVCIESRAGHRSSRRIRSALVLSGNRSETLWNKPGKLLLITRPK